MLARGGKQAKSQARSKTEETWRDLSRGELAKIVQRLYEPNAATGLKKAHLVKFLEAHIWAGIWGAEFYICASVNKNPRRGARTPAPPLVSSSSRACDVAAAPPHASVDCVPYSRTLHS